MPSPSGSTTKYGFPYPLELDTPDIPTGWQTLAQAIENIIATDSQNTLVNRPPAGKSGRYFWATDTTMLYRDNGTTWLTIGPGAGATGATGATGAAGATGATGVSPIAAPVVFAASGVWTPSSTGNAIFSALVVGGGGGGGGNDGHGDGDNDGGWNRNDHDDNDGGTMFGGGGGEVLLNFQLGHITSTQTITIGAGGTAGANGNPTSIGSLVIAAAGLTSGYGGDGSLPGASFYGSNPYTTRPAGTSGGGVSGGTPGRYAAVGTRGGSGFERLGAGGGGGGIGDSNGWSGGSSVGGAGGGGHGSSGGGGGGGGGGNGSPASSGGGYGGNGGSAPANSGGGGGCGGRGSMANGAGGAGGSGLVIIYQVS